ncbi:MAG TPA: hypothetical protein VMY43_06855 [Methanothrix sp.]|nr:hypothetical protein [Methanothrix sp.]
MMTSNFARNNIEKFPNAVSNARSSRWFNGCRYSRLMPSRDVITKYIAGMVDESDAIECQCETLEKLVPAKVFAEFRF